MAEDSVLVLTFALDGGRRPEGRPELLGAAVAARRHVVRNLQEETHIQLNNLN